MRTADRFYPFAKEYLTRLSDPIPDKIGLDAVGDAAETAPTFRNQISRKHAMSPIESARRCHDCVDDTQDCHHDLPIILLACCRLIIPPDRQSASKNDRKSPCAPYPNILDTKSRPISSWRFEQMIRRIPCNHYVPNLTPRRIRVETMPIKVRRSFMPWRRGSSDSM